MRRIEQAFSLVEVLTSLALLAVFSGIVLAALEDVRRSSDRTVAVSNMRRIGQAVLLHALDHEEKLPGPLWPGQVALLDPEREGRLVRELAPYLDIPIPPQPVVVNLFLPPALRRIVSPENLEETRSFVMNMEVRIGEDVINPWGKSDAEGSLPHTLPTIPAGVWGFSDADQQHPRVLQAP